MRALLDEDGEHQHSTSNSDTDVGDTTPLPGASPERQEEFEQLREEFIEEGRDPGRDEEVAARIVNKQRSEFGETAEQESERKAGRAPAHDLPIRNYQKLTVPEVLRQCQKLDLAQLKQILAFEREHRKRRTLIAQLAKQIGEEPTTSA